MQPQGAGGKAVVAAGDRCGQLGGPYTVEVGALGHSVHVTIGRRVPLATLLPRRSGRIPRVRIKIPPALRAAWAPFAIAALILPITAGFLIGGPGPGLALGALTAFALLWIAGRRAPAGMIETQAATDKRRRILLVIGREIDDPRILETAARTTGISFDSDAIIRVVSPTRSSVLDRWAGDFRRGQAEAQRRLVVTVASLATAGVEADARVGDVDLVQAVEDQLRSFAATDVVLITGSDTEDPEAAVAAQELERRLRQPFTRIAA